MTQETCQGCGAVGENVTRASATGNLLCPKCRAEGKARREQMREVDAILAGKKSERKLQSCTLNFSSKTGLKPHRAIQRALS